MGHSSKDNFIFWSSCNSILLLLLSRFSCVWLYRPHRRQPTRLPRPWDSPGKNTGGGCHFLLQCMKVKSESEVAQLCLTLSNPMDCSLPSPPSMGFSRQEYWSGVPLPFLILSWTALSFWPSLSFHWTPGGGRYHLRARKCFPRLPDGIRRGFEDTRQMGWRVFSDVACSQMLCYATRKGISFPESSGTGGPGTIRSYQIWTALYNWWGPRVQTCWCTPGMHCRKQPLYPCLPPLDMISVISPCWSSPFLVLWLERASFSCFVLRFLFMPVDYFRFGLSGTPSKF